MSVLCKCKMEVKPSPSFLCPASLPSLTIRILLNNLYIYKCLYMFS